MIIWGGHSLKTLGTLGLDVEEMVSFIDLDSASSTQQ